MKTQLSAYAEVNRYLLTVICPKSTNCIKANILKFLLYYLKKGSFFSAIVASMTSCVTVKEYQKSRINDSEMELSARKSEKFEQSFYLYREGASGANGGKSGGGCGCN